MENMTRRYCLPFLGVLLFSTVAQGQTTRTVCASGCNNTTIQAAVNAVPSGSGAAAGYTILVHPGAYAEQISLGNKSGTSNNPFIIRAQYACRKPLDGAAWINGNNGLRTIIDGNSTTRQRGFNSPVNDDLRYVLFDGFYFQNQGEAALWLQWDDDLWIKNNCAINTGVSGSDDEGGFVCDSCDNTLWQNNYYELSSSGPSEDASAFNTYGANTIVEYNECALTSPSSNRGRCLYIHYNSNDSVFRYNYFHATTDAHEQITRIRDSLRYLYTHNVHISTVAQNHVTIIDEFDTQSSELHVMSFNTWLYDGGGEDDFPALAPGKLNGAVISNNIIYSGVSDTNSYAVGRYYTAGSHSITFSNNVWYRWAGFRDPLLCASGCNFSESGTINTNPSLNASTGCASAVSNNTYGANVNISSIPYRKCDGTAYPVASKFSLLPPAAPSTPKNLRIIP
jgi:hypothetical protein